MPSQFNKNPSTDISCIIEFTSKSDKLGWLKTYDTSLYGDSLGLPHNIIDDNDLPCRIMCFLGDHLTEPTENSVAICSGGLCDMGPGNSVQINLSQKAEYVIIPTSGLEKMIILTISCQVSW